MGGNAVMAVVAADEGLSTFITSITGALNDFTITNLTTILVAALGMTSVLAIGWFAYRFIVRKVSGAMKKGRI